MTTLKNKRKSERCECVVPIDGKQGGVFRNVITTDISKTGMGFVSQCKIPVNKEIPIELDLEENGEPVFVIAKVKWVKPIPQTTQYRLGLNFESVLSGGKTRLNKYFKKT